MYVCTHDHELGTVHESDLSLYIYDLTTLAKLPVILP